jgi:uncharacterized protein YbaP (TraB family)
MKKYFVILVSFFTIFTFTSCTIFQGEEKNYMWKVEDDNSYVYILGSIHTGKSETFPLDSIIEKAYQDSDFLAVELNVDNINPMEVMLKGVYSGDSTLRDNLSDKSYQKISEIFKKNNIPEASYSKFRPWLAIMTVTQLEVSKSGYDSQSGIDYYFLQKSKKDDKEVLELESLEEQIKALSSLDKMADDYFNYAIEEMDKTGDYIDDIYKYWSRGDTNGVAKYMNMGNDREGYEIFNQKLLFDRNIKFAEEISNYLRDNKKVFVVVGAGHFTGSEGILQLLENKNFKITQK